MVGEIGEAKLAAEGTGEGRHTSVDDQRSRSRAFHSSASSSARFIKASAAAFNLSLRATQQQGDRHRCIEYNYGRD